jgi:hypothetical protein
VLPGVLAVEDDGNGGVFTVAALAARGKAMGGVPDARDEVSRRRFGVPGLIDKANPIGEFVVAKYTANGSPLHAEFVRAIKSIG